MELLFNIIGHPGAGKSEACRYLKEQWNFEVYSPSDLIRNFAAKNGFTPKGREAFGRCHELMVEKDPLAFMRPVLNKETLRLCVDGLRSPLDTQRLKTRGGYVIALIASPAIRYGRVSQDSQRSTTRAPSSFEEFCDSEKTDAHTDPRLTNTQAVIGMADFIIDTNSLSIQNVTTEIDAITRDLLGPKGHKASRSLYSESQDRNWY